MRLIELCPRYRPCSVRNVQSGEMLDREGKLLSSRVILVIFCILSGTCKAERSLDEADKVDKAGNEPTSVVI